MRFKKNWDESRARYECWWNRSSMGRPLLHLVAVRCEKPLPPVQCQKAEELYLNAEKIVQQKRLWAEQCNFDYAEAYPSVDLNLGPGSLACYLGAEPHFTEDTIWYEPCVKQDWKDFPPLNFHQQNRWFQTHLSMFHKANQIIQGDFAINIPDLIENLDILAALRGPQELCCDLMDNPQEIQRRVRELDDLYFRYYDSFYQICKLDGGSSYTAFSIWGKGRVAKVQCDFSAMISPNQFREFVLESLRKQCRSFNHSLYHLDGPDALRHLDAVLEIQELDAVQWVPGAGNPGMWEECWFPVYEKIRKAEKSLWIQIDGSNAEELIAKAEPLVKRFGHDGLFLIFPPLPEADAWQLLKRADTYW